MSKSDVIELEEREDITDPLTARLRDGAQRLIQQAVGAEWEELLAQHNAGGKKPYIPPGNGNLSVLPFFGNARLTIL